LIGLSQWDRHDCELVFVLLAVEGQKYVDWVLAAVSYVHPRKADFFSKKVSEAACLLPRADRRKRRGMGSDLFFAVEKSDAHRTTAVGCVCALYPWYANRNNKMSQRASITPFLKTVLRFSPPFSYWLYA
jgi:hypothetical protein